MEKQKFWHTAWFTYIFLVILPVIGIIILWACNKNFSKVKKIILTIVFLIWFLILCAVNSGNEPEQTQFSQNNTVKVELADFSTMTNEAANNWCSTNKINCSLKEEYSDTVQKDKLINQSIGAGTNIVEGSKVTLTYSLGKKPSIECMNALIKAEVYSKEMYMSKKAIYEQLISEYGEGFSKDAAQYAIDNLKADYNKNALEKAKVYLNEMHMSKNAIYEQLTSKYGEKFTTSEAKYAVDNLYNE